MDDITSVLRARVMATYSALSSSRARAACSACSTDCAHAGGFFSDTKNTNFCGAAAAPGQSISTVMLSALRGAVSVSSSSTASASRPLAP